MFAAAPSKLPFYIAGGLLAVWAVLLAGWGITHAEFPGSEGRGRLVMLTSFVLVAATITAAVLTGGGEEHAAGAARRRRRRDARSRSPPTPAARCASTRPGPRCSPAA